MRVAAAAATLLGVAGEAATAGTAREATFLFLGPAGGPDAAAAEDVRVGVVAGLASAAGSDLTTALVPAALPDGEDDLQGVLTPYRKGAVAAVLAYVPDGRTAGVVRAAEKAGLPLVVLSPEETAPSLDPSRAVFWAGGLRPADEALQAMDFLLLPLGSRKPAVLHDGSARGADAAARCAVLHHAAQTPSAAAALPPAFDGAAAAQLVADGADGVVYFGGPAGAERLLAAADAASWKIPVLLGQGLAASSVPRFVEGRARNAWALEVAWFEDHDAVAEADRAVLGAAAKTAGRPLLAATVRGYRAGRWVTDAARAGGTDGKGFVAALRALARPGARGRPVFEPWGHATLGRFTPWRSPAERDEPACRRVRPTLMPMAGIPQIGTFRASAFRWEEGTTYVHCSFGRPPDPSKPAKEGAPPKEGDRTIDRDLRALGLHTGGYEAALEEMILDDLMGRFLSRMNRLFLRNPDGTSIPGLSYRISFTAEPPPKGVKAQKLYVVIAGDDPEAGGRASGNLARVFSTFLQRTMYAERALVPPVAASDRPYLTGAYRWGSSVAENLRCDTVRALLDGYSQAMALTGAHEVGHVLGLGHDTETPRSIMNVVDAVGLDFEWAEWIPSHARTIEQRLGRTGDRD